MSSTPAEPAEPEDFRSDALPAGAQLLRDQYTIEKFLNSGGFGITYLARDSLDRQVVIKECFPNGICTRTELKVRARIKTLVEDFDKIKERFVQEARSLAGLQHPNIVGVHQVFEDNNTAYMALDFVKGRDLLELTEDADTKLEPEVIRGIAVRLLKAIEFMHSKGMLHRDISPDNILVRDNFEPVLIDFGSAKPSSAKKNGRTVTEFRVVKDGYSPQEFYIPDAAQTPASDLYAFGATLYHAITGEVPAESQKRLAAFAGSEPDPLEPLGPMVDGYDATFLDAIHTALNIRASDRLQSAGEWLDLIGEASADEAKLIPLDGETPPAVGNEDPVLFGAEDGDQPKRDDPNTDDLVRAILEDDPESSRGARNRASKVVPTRINRKTRPRSTVAGEPQLDPAALRSRRSNRSLMPYVASVAGAVLVSGLSYGAWTLSQPGTDADDATANSSVFFPSLAEAPVTPETGGLAHRVDGLIQGPTEPVVIAGPLVARDRLIGSPVAPSIPDVLEAAELLSPAQASAPELDLTTPATGGVRVAARPETLALDESTPALPGTLPSQPTAILVAVTTGSPSAPEPQAKPDTIANAEDPVATTAPIASLAEVSRDVTIGTPPPLDGPVPVALGDVPPALAREGSPEPTTLPRILSVRTTPEPPVPSQARQLADTSLGEDQIPGISGQSRAEPPRPVAIAPSLEQAVAAAASDELPAQVRIALAPKIGPTSALSPVDGDILAFETAALTALPPGPGAPVEQAAEGATTALPTIEPTEDTTPEPIETAALDETSPQPVAPWIVPVPDDGGVSPRIISVPQPADTEAVTPEPEPESAETVTIPVGSSITSTWVVGLPFTGSISQPTRIASVFPDAPNWMESGQELVSVNGVQIDDIASIPSILKLITSIDGRSEIEVRVEYRGAGSDTVREGQATFAVVLETALNQHVFQTRFDEAWRTFVVESPSNADDGMRKGDEVVAYLQTNETFEEPDAFQRLLERELAAGLPILSFAIRRDGDLWAAGFATGN